jgi:hypothetical protein
MLLEILGALKRLAAKLALVRLERDVNTDVRGDVITLDSGGAARVPLASEVQVVGALAADMALTDVLLVHGQPQSILERCSWEEDMAYIERLRVGKPLVTGIPATSEVIIGDGSRDGSS